MKTIQFKHLLLLICLSISLCTGCDNDDKTKRYIANQEKHHKKMNFEEEYLMFLKEYGINYNEKYLWHD